ncbi:signal recognition particle-related / SRP-related [Zea mays]|uniref:Signal recognition particle subunit SRP68 n=1 Tax=Zea mays TaxID=4577 RepID=A0A1D6KGW3_MAIZE|nr:signal recognition particle-related / SRP-related [Zea mays]
MESCHREENFWYKCKNSVSTCLVDFGKQLNGRHFSQLCFVKGDSRKSLEADAYASYMKGALFSEQDKNIDAIIINFKNTRAIYEEPRKYGSIENELLCYQCIEEVEPANDLLNEDECASRPHVSLTQAMSSMDFKDYSMAHNLIGCCLQLYMNQKEVVDTLSLQAKNAGVTIGAFSLLPV